MFKVKIFQYLYIYMYNNNCEVEEVRSEWKNHADSESELRIHLLHELKILKILDLF